MRCGTMCGTTCGTWCGTRCGVRCGTRRGHLSLKNVTAVNGFYRLLWTQYSALIEE